MYNIGMDEAADIFYNSELLPLIENGVADLHCRSDKYLACEIWRDYKEATLSKILCKWEQDSVISFFLYLDSVFKDKYKLVHNQSPV